MWWWGSNVGRRGDPECRKKEEVIALFQSGTEGTGVEGEHGKGMQEEEGGRRQRSVVKDGSKS